MNQQEVVFLPGTLCNRAVFEEQITALQKRGITCHCIDFGEADSLAAMAQKTLEQVQSQRFSVVAFSMGGMVAFELFRQVPERIASLVLIASNAHADVEGRAEVRQQHLIQAQAEGLEPLMRDLYMPNYLYAQKKQHQDLIVDMAMKLGTGVFEAQLKVLAERPDSTALLTSIECPTLLIGGDWDPLCPVAEQSRMHELIKGSVLSIEMDCGHFVTLEAAGTVNQSLLDWFVGDDYEAL